jgi:hypothetical protein
MWENYCATSLIQSRTKNRHEKSWQHISNHFLWTEVVITDNRTITAQTLLLGFLELRSLTPELNNWTEELLSDNPPRLFRLRQLTALFQAFGIPWGPQSFVKGKFIQSEDHRYDSLLSKLSTELQEDTSCEVWDRHRLPRFFATLFDYRQRVDDVLSFSSGVLLSSGLFLLAHSKIGELNRIILKNIADIDDTLVALICPEMAVFSVEQLVRNYDYPDVDLTEIDVDWI